MKYKIVDEFRSRTTVNFICNFISITPSSYYRWIKKGRPDYEIKFDVEFANAVKEIYISENGKYGYPRIAIVLNNASIKCSYTKVYRYMKLLNIASIIRVKKMNRKPKEQKNTKSGLPNIVNRNWNIYDVNELWVTDVTYIPLNLSKQKFAYLSVMRDACSGFIVGYSTSLVNDVMIYKDTIKDSDKYRDFRNQIIVHSDNGNQYTSHFAKKYAKDNNIIISLSRPGNSLDNAMCETFFSSLKSEIPELLKQSDFKIISQMIDDYIYYYNYKRIMIKHKGAPCLKYFENKITTHSSRDAIYL